jgi:hypothetical protein
MLVGILLVLALDSSSQRILVNGHLYTAPVEPPAANDTINVNVHKSSGGIGITSLPGWNNWGFANGAVNANTGALLKSDGSSTPITVTLSQVNDFNDNGSSWGTGNTMGFPAEVFRASAYNTGTPRTLTFNNVPAGVYKLELVSSRATTQTRPNTFAVGATTSTVDAWNNLTNLVVLDNLTPSGSTITVTITHTQGFNFINAFRLIRYEDALVLILFEKFFTYHYFRV